MKFDPNRIEAGRFNADPSRWRLHRLGTRVASGGVTPLRTARVTPATTIDRPDSWRFAMQVDPRRDPRHADFRRALRGSLVLPDDEAVSEALDRVSTVRSSLYPNGPPNLHPDDLHSDDDLIAATEYDAWSKFTIQRGTLTTWHLDLPGPKPCPSFQSFDVAAAQLAREYASLRVPNERFPAPPADTVGGWPGFTSGPPSKVLASCFACVDDDGETWVDEAADWAHSVGLDPLSALGYGLGGRSGPLAKPVVFWRWAEEHWAPYMALAGCAQRNRIVNMAKLE